MSTIILFSLAMLVGCYLCGCIPLAFSFSDSNMRLVTIFGAGLLVGVALAIIIPEGVHAMYFPSTEGHSEHHDHPSLSPGLGAAKTAAQNAGELASKHNDHSITSDAHRWIGLALVIGFVFMLLVDNLGKKASQSKDSEGSTSFQSKKGITATLGLVVHAAADGIALGAASSVAQFQIEVIVFLAIMLHKGPAAFGLVSFLLHDGLDRKAIRRHLLIFSLASPLGAILTYLCLSQQSKQNLSDVNATGFALLFSAGTFLYVATVHILPELSSSSHSHQMRPSAPAQSSTTPSSGPPGSVEVSLTGTSTILESVGKFSQASKPGNQAGFSLMEMALFVIGSGLPLVLSANHSH